MKEICLIHRSGGNYTAPGFAVAALGFLLVLQFNFRPNRKKSKIMVTTEIVIAFKSDCLSLASHFDHTHTHTPR